jgi:hypothetical protein
LPAEEQTIIQELPIEIAIDTLQTVLQEEAIQMHDLREIHEIQELQEILETHEIRELQETLVIHETQELHVQTLEILYDLSIDQITADLEASTVQDLVEVRQ